MLLLLLSLLLPACGRGAAPPTWTRLCTGTSCGTPPPSVRWYCAAVHANRLIVFGGSPAATSAVYALPLGPPPGDWLQLCAEGGGACGPAPGARRAAMAGLIGDALYVYGGWDGTDYFGDVWRLDLAPAVAWRQLCADSGAAACGGLSPAQRSRGAVAVVGAQLYVFGGYCTGPDLNGLHFFDTATTQWTTVCPACAPSIRGSAGLVYDAVSNTLLLFGGETGSVLLNDLWQATPGAAPNWQQLTPAMGTPLGVEDHGLAVLPGTRLLVVMFGNTGGDPPLQAYDLTTQAWTANLTTTAGLPAGRAGISATPDGGGLVMFGGSSATTDYLGVWRLTAGAAAPAGATPVAGTAGWVIIAAAAGGAVACGGGVLVALKLALKGGLTGATAAQRRAANNAVRDATEARVRAELAGAQAADDSDGSSADKRSVSDVSLSAVSSDASTAS